MKKREGSKRAKYKKKNTHIKNRGARGKHCESNRLVGLDPTCLNSGLSYSFVLGVYSSSYMVAVDMDVFVVVVAVAVAVRLPHIKCTD